MHEIKRYLPAHPQLQKLIKCFWINSGELPALDHKLLPIRNIDLIIHPASRPLVLNDGVSDIRLQSCYCTGIMDQFKYRWKRPAGNSELIGISFFPAGFYPFFGVPLSEFKNHCIEMRVFDERLPARLAERVQEQETAAGKLYVLECELLKLLQTDLIVDPRMEALVFEFMNLEESTIEDFCDAQGIHKRRLERFTNQFLGAPPKTFQKINRFRKSLHGLLNGGYGTLTELAYDCGYYDQMHCIREFKRFTGTTPARFLAEKNSVRQISFFS